MTPHSILSLAALLVGVAATPVRAESNPAREIVSFGALKGPTAEQARSQALAWLQKSGKADSATLKAFDQVWAATGRSLADRVADSLALGDPEAAKLLADVRDPAKAAPVALPAILKDSKRPVFYRANLTLVYAKTLANRRIYEEALEALKSIKPEQVVDPSAYLFHRAIAEHALLLKEDANRSISRLLDDAVEVPDRYKMVSVLMAMDMENWREKDLGWIARKMDNIERRLELARGGPKTQKIQKEVVARLDEIIKQLENQAKGNSNGGSCPNGGQPGSPGANPSMPQPDSYGGKNSGKGEVDQKRLDGLAKQWGKLPPKQQAEAMQELTRDMPPKYREVIETYFRKLAASDTNRP
jgi:hypothetical protein